MPIFEKPAKAPAGLRAAVRDLAWPYALNGLAAVVTISNITILNVGAPFWGLLFGLLASALLEREDFHTLGEARS